jgi:hypothetical protein
VTKKKAERIFQEAVVNKGNDPESHQTEAVSPAKIAIDALRKALDMVHSAEMTVAEVASVEDEVFEAFSKLREKKKRAKR